MPTSTRRSQEIRTALLEADVELGGGPPLLRRHPPAGQHRGALQEPDARASRSSRPSTRSWSASWAATTLKLTYASRPPTVVLHGRPPGLGQDDRTSAKLALWWKQQGRNPLLVGADLQRPAAVEQLRVLGEQAGVTVFSEATDPVAVRQGRARGGPAPGQGRLHHRHRRPADHRCRADGRDPGHLGGDRTPLHVPGHRRHDRPGRRRHRQGLPRDPRARRRHPDQARRRRPRRRRARRSRGWSASRSRSPAPASGWPTSTSSTPIAWPTASSAWATCSA